LARPAPPISIQVIDGQGGLAFFAIPIKHPSYLISTTTQQHHITQHIKENPQTH